jgi:hypothetical protein
MAFVKNKQPNFQENIVPTKLLSKVKKREAPLRRPTFLTVGSSVDDNCVHDTLDIALMNKNEH